MNIKSLQLQTKICDWPSQCVPEYPSRQEQLNPCAVVVHVPLFRHGESEQGVSKIMKNKKHTPVAIIFLTVYNMAGIL